MSQPTPYTPNADFSQQEANNASGRSTVNTAALDAEFAAIETTLDQTIANLQLIQRDDGKLGDVSVDVRCLSQDVLNIMGGFSITGLWVAETDYAVNDICSTAEYTYVCKTAHTSGVSFSETNWIRFGFTAGSDAAQAAAEAQASANAAASSETNANAYKNTAQSSATDAALSASSAYSSATTATTKASEAANSATSAANSASTAAAIAAVSTGIPSGTVAHFAMSSAPTGWVKANGSALSRTAYADLFSAIGTTFGAGDGSTTFNVPDLRGEFLRGLDDGRGIDLGRTLGSAQENTIQSHNHPIVTVGTPGSGSSTGMSSISNGSLVGTVTMYISANGSSETRPRNVSLLACIKY